MCRYTASNKPYRPQSSVEVVARAAERAQKASLGQLDDTSRSPSTGCPLVNPTDWPFALRNQEAADLFRKRAYRAARLQPPSEDPLAAIPKQITVVSAAGGEVVTNKVRTLPLCDCCAAIKQNMALQQQLLHADQAVEMRRSRTAAHTLLLYILYDCEAS